MFADQKFQCCVCYTDENSSEVKTEVDDMPNDVTKYSSVKPRPHLCTVCNKRFLTTGSLNQHIQRHNEEKLHSCTQCEKRFTTKQYLKQHMNVHRGKFMCTECGKCCRNSLELKLHRRSCLLYTSDAADE